MNFQERKRFIKSVNLRRLVNASAVISSYLAANILRKPIIWGAPPVVMIEPTNICNLKCPLCPSGNGTLKRERGVMSFETFKKVIDEIRHYALMVVLWNQGEPFLNPDFCRMVRYASDAGLYTLTSSNLNIMPSADEVIDSGLDAMIISLDGTTQETYNRYRVNGTLEKVLQNVRQLASRKTQRGAKNPILRWQFLVMKHNEHELETVKAMAREYKVDKLELKSVQIYQKSDIEEFLPTDPKYRRYKVSKGDFELKYTIKNKCKRLWAEPVVNWNGEVGVCCFDKDVEWKVGNIHDDSLRNIWHNGSFTKLRRQILRNRSAIKMCRNCLEGSKLRLEEKKV